MEEHRISRDRSSPSADVSAIEKTDGIGHIVEKGMENKIIQETNAKIMANAKAKGKAKGKAIGKKNKGKKKGNQVNKIAGRVGFLGKMIEALEGGELQQWKVALMQQYNIHRVGMSRRHLYRLGAADKRKWCRSCGLPYINDNINDEGKNSVVEDPRNKLLIGPLANSYIPGEDSSGAATRHRHNKEEKSKSWTLKDYEERKGIFKTPTSIDCTAEPKVCSLCRYGKRYTTTKNKKMKTDNNAEPQKKREIENE